MDFFRSLFRLDRPGGYSIAGVLDDDSDAFIRNLWQLINDELGIEHQFVNAIPHITHIQARQVHTREVREALTRFAKATAPYTVRTAGLGIFTGEKTAIYIPVVRNPLITAVQNTLIEALDGSIDDIPQTHFIDYWIPHITLLLPDMIGDRLQEAIQLLSTQDFTREMMVTGFVLLGDDPDDEREPFRVALSGPATASTET